MTRLIHKRRSGRRSYSSITSLKYRVAIDRSSARSASVIDCSTARLFYVSDCERRDRFVGPRKLRVSPRSPLLLGRPKVLDHIISSSSQKHATKGLQKKSKQTNIYNLCVSLGTLREFYTRRLKIEDGTSYLLTQRRHVDISYAARHVAPSECHLTQFIAAKNR